MAKDLLNFAQKTPLAVSERRFRRFLWLVLNCQRLLKDRHRQAHGPSLSAIEM